MRRAILVLASLGFGLFGCSRTVDRIAAVPTTSARTDADSRTAPRQGKAPRSIEIIDSGEGVPPLGSYQYHYPGGPNTLPYGQTDGWDLGLAAHARSMPAVQHAMTKMSGRGYIRRQDLDCGVQRLGYACALISYEKPGHAVTEEQPVIMVVTKPFDVGGVGWVPATQVMCGLFRDSSDVLLTAGTESDSAIIVVAQSVLGSPNAGLESAIIAAGVPSFRSDEDFVYMYSAYESGSGFTDWRDYTSPGMQQIWNGWSTVMGITAVGTTIGAGPAWFQPPWGTIGACCAVIGACYTADRLYWAFPPDTLRRP